MTTFMKCNSCTDPGDTGPYIMINGKWYHLKHYTMRGISGALARGYTHDENSRKQLDPDLITAMEVELTGLQEE